MFCGLLPVLFAVVGGEVFPQFGAVFLVADEWT
jgi:hypothetical protein